MNKTEFLEDLTDNPKDGVVSTRIIRTYQIEPKDGDGNPYNDPNDVEVWETIVFDKFVAGNGQRRTIPFYVEYSGDQVKEVVTPMREDDAESDFLKKVRLAVATKKASGDFYTAKITKVDENEKFADIEVTASTPNALEVEKRSYRLRLDPNDQSKIVVSKVVNEMKAKFFEGWSKVTNTVSV